MLKTLVAIEVDLASSLAIRYACRLGNIINLELHPVYVKAPPPEVPATGTGWVRRTWERELVEVGREEIRELLASEMETCPMLQEPRVIYGDREYELLRIIGQEPFNLYLEGAPYPFTPVNIHRRLASRFYQRINMPLIWLRILRQIKQVLVVCQDQAAVRALLPVIQKMWAGCPVPVHLGAPPPGGYGGPRDALREQVTAAAEELEAAGCQVAVKEIAALASGGPSPEFTKDYGLVAVSLEKAIKKDNPQLQWLSQLKAPLMLVLR